MLVECKECNERISKSAKQCPKCGYGKGAEFANRMRIVATVFGVIFIIIPVSLFFLALVLSVIL